MTDSGGKGTSINLYQVATCVGQQDFANGRVENKFHNRTLPHFEPHDRSPLAAGFCENSFIVISRYLMLQLHHGFEPC